jgi:hypothetical protein
VTRVDKAPFGPSWLDDPENWTIAANWLLNTGHEIHNDEK